jgi:hypothetical protein
MQNTTKEPYIDSVNVIETIECKAGFTSYIIEIAGHSRFLLNAHSDKQTTYKIKSRYSDMLEFHNVVTQQLASTAKLTVDFPPKKYISTHSIEFLEQRKAQLQLYFTHLLNSHKHSIQKPLLEFCSPTKANIVLCGGKNSKKSEFISMLVKVVKNKVVSETRYHSFPLKKASVIFKNTSTIELPCISSVSDSMSIINPSS